MQPLLGGPHGITYARRNTPPRSPELARSPQRAATHCDKMTYAVIRRNRRGTKPVGLSWRFDDLDRCPKKGRPFDRLVPRRYWSRYPLRLRSCTKSRVFSNNVMSPVMRGSLVWR